MHSINRFLIIIAFSVSIIFAQAKIDSYLQDKINLGETSLEVVVTFNGDGPPSEQQLNILSETGISLGYSFQSLPMAGIIATPEQILSLASNPEVHSLYFNRQLEYYNNNSRGITGVDQVRENLQMTSANNGFPVSGKGVGVLVHDSGIDATHDDLLFGQKVVQNAMGSTNPAAYNDLSPAGNILPIVYIQDIPTTDNNSGHGTHVAGTIGGTGVKSGGKYEGVAPGTDLIGYGSGAVLLVLDALGGFDYAITHQIQYGIRIINNSWGSSGSFNPDHPINIASYKAYKRGMVVVFSAGNSGPIEGTNTPYAAPWVITVAAGNPFGGLTDFSSRGINDESFTFIKEGQTWTYENRPTITGPGDDVVSTRAISPVPVLGAPADSELDPAHIPFYTTMSGTSMSSPHIAGICALLLEINPSLKPMEIKEILQKTATNMPGYETWEVGAGYVNAYAAVDYVFGNSNYGSTVNHLRNYNSNVELEIWRDPFVIDFNPVILLSSTGNSATFEVVENTNIIEVVSYVSGITGEEGNPIEVVLIAPDGTEYDSGIYVAFTLYHDRGVVVADPMPGTWTVKYSSLYNLDDITLIGFPETIEGYIKHVKVLGYTGLNDITNHAAETSIKLAVGKRLADGYSNGKFRPNRDLTRYELADYLMMGQAVRQYLPFNNFSTYGDVSGDQKLIVESIAKPGTALKDRFWSQEPIILPKSINTFSPNDKVKRYEIAYSLIQALGLQEAASQLDGNIIVRYSNEDIPVDDANEIPGEFKKHVQLALMLNLINVYFSLEQGPFDLTPTLHAEFRPNNNVKRGEFATIITRTHDVWNQTQLPKSSNLTTIENMPLTYELTQNYPNPFNPATTINYTLPEASIVTLSIYNILGEKIATLLNEKKEAGSYSIDFDASNLSSGVYIYQIKAGNFVKSMKMSLLK